MAKLRLVLLLTSFLLLLRHSLFCEGPIDVVYTWVDGADAKWQEVRNRYFLECHPFVNNADANTKNRYRNRDELKYSLRSLAQFAPFINHIYIVTFGQRPAWLKDDPKITIIDHQLIFPNKANLPTFNSQAIEANLHRIPNLSEKFIYFNDDVFLGTNVDVGDFFTEEGQIYAYLSDYKVPTGSHIPNESAYHSAWRNTNALLNTSFKKERRYEVAHAPFPLSKTLIQEVEMRFPFVFQLVSSHKFRMPTDFTITNGLIQYYALYTRKAKVARVDSPIVKIKPELEKNAKKLEKVKTGMYKFFCVQDSLDDDCIAADKQLHDFLQAYYPTPSPWEAVEEAKPIESNTATTEPVVESTQLAQPIQDIFNL